ncbi:ferritin family protein [Streptomyces sp. NPDC060053]|uniref:ferritin family protein n=1 Tax=Streptomyces sp. NPDC060053 TaxID=3347047 RepID=UPI00369FC0F6
MAHPSESYADGLHAVLAAEAVCAQRYTYFAQVAETEGHTETARLFTDLAASAACAAHGHLDVLRDLAVEADGPVLGDTRTNLAAAVAEALNEAVETYPRLTTTAHERGHGDVASWLTTLTALKKSHVAKFDTALRELSGASDD